MTHDEITLARNAAKAQLRAVVFTFDDGERGFIGFTDDSLWNGFLNVRCFPSERDKIDAYFREQGMLDQDDDFAVPVSPDGFIDLSGGFATTEAEWGSDAHVDAENALGDEVGHPEACTFTMKATTSEIIAHLLTREPVCDGFVDHPACRFCGWSQDGRTTETTCPSCGKEFDWA